MRRVTVVAAALALVAAVGVVLSRRSGPTADRAMPEPASNPSSSMSSTAPVAPHATDVSAARDAGIRAVSRTGEVVRAGMFSRPDVVAEFATPRFAPTLAEETTTDVNAFVVALGADGTNGSDVSVLEVPLTAMARAEDDDVVVEVWSVLIVTVPDEATAREAWRTVTVTMDDVDGRWLVDAWSSSAGPAPAPAPASAPGARSEVDDRLAWPAAAGEEA